MGSDASALGPCHGESKARGASLSFIRLPSVGKGHKSGVMGMVTQMTEGGLEGDIHSRPR